MFSLLCTMFVTMTNEEIRAKLQVIVNDLFSFSEGIHLIRLRDKEYQQLLQTPIGTRVGIINAHHTDNAEKEIEFAVGDVAVAVRISLSGKVSDMGIIEPKLAGNEPVIVLKFSAYYSNLSGEFLDASQFLSDVLITGGAQNVQEFMKNKYGGIREIPPHPDYFVRVYKVLGVFEAELE